MLVIYNQTSYSITRYSAKADKQVSFYLLVEGKADPTWGLSLDKLEAEEVIEDLHIDMKESISEIKRSVNQAKRTQWIRRSSMSKDIMRNEALKCKLNCRYALRSKSHSFLILK